MIQKYLISAAQLEKELAMFPVSMILVGTKSTPEVDYIVRLQPEMPITASLIAKLDSLGFISAKFGGHICKDQPHVEILIVAK